MTDTLAVQYKTNRGFYINQYVGGTFSIAFSGTIDVGKTTISGTSGLKINLLDPTTSQPLGEYAIGIKGGSLGPYTVTHSTITDVITGESRQVTELKFEVPLPGKGFRGADISLYEKVTGEGNPLLGFKDGDQSFGLAATIGGKLADGTPGSVGVELDIAPPSYSVDVDTHYTPQENGTVLKTVYQRNGVAYTERLDKDGNVIETFQTEYNLTTYVTGYKMGHCFPAGTMIDMADGSRKPIEEIRLGDLVLAFDGISEQQTLVARPVTRLFGGMTSEWLALYPVQKTASGNGEFEKLIVTPGHRFLDKNGDFRRIDEILSDDRHIVLRDGSVIEIFAESISYSADTADCFEVAECVTNAFYGNAALAPRSQVGWKTYNFEVGDLHTYIAGGVRVHNDSIDNYIPSDAVVLERYADESGIARDARYIRSDGVVVFADGTAGPDGNTIRIKETLTFPSWSSEGNGATVTQVRTFDAAGIESSRKVTHLEFDGSVVELESITSSIGLVLGKELGGDSLFGQVAAGTVISAIAGNIGEFLQKADFLSGSLTDGSAWSSDPLGDAVKSAFADFGHDIATGAISQLSSLLMAELAESIGLDGFEGGLFTSMGGTITTQLLRNAYNVAVIGENPATGAAYTMLDGFQPTELLGSLSGAIGGYLGSYLASELILPDNPQAAIGTSIGSSIGAYLGSFIPIPVVGTLIGSFLGNMFGTVIGNAVGTDVKAWGGVSFDPNTGKFNAGGFSADNGGDWQTFVGITTAVAQHVTQIIDITGARVVGAGSLSFYQKGTTYTLYLADGSGFDFASRYTTNMEAAWAGAGDRGAMSLLKSLQLEGGDSFVLWALRHSSATNTSALISDMKIAESYSKYIRNAEAINLLIKEQPKSAFAMGWILTLMKAKELGIDQIRTLRHEGTTSADDLAGTTLEDSMLGLAGNDVLSGKAGNDKLHGDLGNDRLHGGIGEDRLFGGEGDDSLYGDDGDDTLYGGNGHDALTGGSGVNWLYGEVGSDTLTGGESSDHLEGGADHDSLIGNGGNDQLFGDDGNDTLMGGIGADSLYGGAGADVLAGDDGDDVLEGGAGANSLSGGAGNDRLNGGEDRDTLNGDDGNDQLRGWAGDDALSGGAGDDTLIADDGQDSLSGGLGQDSLFGGAGNDTLSGDDGNDRLEGGADDDTLSGGAGADRLLGDDGADLLYGGADADTLDGGAGNDTLWGGSEDDSITGGLGDDTLHGEAGNDSLYGAEGVDLLHGEDGNDVLSGGESNDSLYGGQGNDSLTGGDGDDLLEGHEGADTLTGGIGQDSLSAGAGDDQLYGEDGNDTLHGGEGFDVMQGGAGHDTMSGDLGNDVLDGGDGDDLLLGDAGDDALTGGNGNDTLDGGAGDDILTGGYGNDRLIGGPDTDIIDGGEDEDTVVLSGRRTDYKITLNTAIGKFSIVDERAASPDGTDLVDVEIFEFADKTYTKTDLDYFISEDRKVVWDIVRSDGAKTVLGWDADAQGPGQTEIYIQQFNAAGVQRSQTTFKADGSRVTWVEDVDNTQSWAKYTQTFDSQGRLTLQVNKNDNGTTNEWGWDPANAQPWARYSVVYDALGRKTEQLNKNDDGTSTQWVWDPGNVHNWSVYQINSDVYDRRVWQRTTYDDNSFTDYGWDYGAANWSTWENRYDTLGRLTWQRTVYDDNSFVDVSWDQVGAQTWWSVQYNYDVYGRLVWQRITYDNGTMTDTSWDHAGAQTWWTVVTNMDAAGRATYQRISWDNGTFTDTSWDYGATNWSYIQTAIDAAGRATSQRVQYDDGSFIDYGWDYTAYELNHWWVNYDAAGRQTNQTYLYDNGTRKVWAWDYTSGVTWSNYRIDYDTSGRQTYRVNNYDDGTKRVYDWDYTTSVTWTDKRIDYDAAGRDAYKIINYDNGHKTTWDYDYTSGVNWKILERKYDSAGRLYEQTYTYDTGTKLVEKWDVSNSDIWYYQYLNYNAAGTLVYGRVQLDNGQWGTARTPVVIDLAGDGVDLVSLSHSSATFDWEGSDGVKERTAWVSGEDGFLVIDLASNGGAGGDGLIDQEKEVAFTSWAPDTSSDMEALAAAFDSNTDGIFDSRDARWGEFRIWQDVNQNGQADQGELRTLESWGIASIGLNLIKETQSLPDASMITGTGVVTWSEGRQTTAGDVSLAYAPAILDDLYGPDARIALSTSQSETFEVSSKTDGFLFGHQFGHDTLDGFDASGTHDVIIFSKSTFIDFADVMASAKQSGDDTVIQADSENSLTLKNVMLASLQADDFRFTI